MMRRDRRSQTMLVLLAACSFAGVGCMNTAPRIATPQQTYIPPAGAVPAELAKVTLPEYVIEPPDVLRIEALIRVPEEDPKTKKKVPSDQLRSLPLQPVWGEYRVRPDGTVYLGVYGSVPVAGYTLRQAAEAVRQTLAQQAFAEADGLSPEFLIVLLDVTQYNSKVYYVITDGGGNGEQVLSFPIQGSETVLDAVSNVGGLSPVSSKRNIWVARRTPNLGQQEQILPVDWVGISQHGVTQTNYQIMPGDRVYVKAERLVTLDTRMARLLSPIERALGITLLGTTTTNQIRGRGYGFGNNNNN